MNENTQRVYDAYEKVTGQPVIPGVTLLDDLLCTALPELVRQETTDIHTALWRCWAELATEHERNYPLPQPLLEAMREAWNALGQPGRSEADA